MLELSPADAAEQKLAKSLVGCLNDNNGRFKPNGLIKKVIPPQSSYFVKRADQRYIRQLQLLWTGPTITS